MEIKATDKSASFNGSAATSAKPQDTATAASGEEKVAADAVKVALSAPTTATKVTEQKTKEFTDERLKEIARRAEAAFKGTKVQFGPSSTEEDPPAINFKVMDKETGRVIREFPAEELESVVDKFEASRDESAHGAFVEVVA